MKKARGQRQSGCTSNMTIDPEMEACFEAGIKLGALYHQFVGTPLSFESLNSLETAIEDSIRNQRYVSDIHVEINGVEPNQYGYDELGGTMLDVELVVKKDGVTVEAVLREENGYPLMSIENVTA